jgi:C-3',4' desaturase CrtD
MGGMSAGSLLAQAGYDVLILEAAHVPGGCSSSFYRKGYVFESGATTLIGFDEDQPLHYLEQELGIQLTRQEMQPSMSVWMNEQRESPLIRHKSMEDWISAVGDRFGHADGQRKFWKLAKQISDVIWKVSLSNPFFPPQQPSDLWALIRDNDWMDTWILPYAFKNTAEVAQDCGIASPSFLRFLDEQLMITAQARAQETPFLIGAAGLTYTNYSNYYVPGGLLEMVRELQQFIEDHHGKLKVREPVESIMQGDQSYRVTTNKSAYHAPIVISNVPIWNLQSLTRGAMQTYFDNVSRKFDRSVGALTFGIAMEDIFEESITLHHQIHIPEGDVPTGMESHSLFVSLSAPDDEQRAPKGYRTLNVSTHADPAYWNRLNGTYEAVKKQIGEAVIELLDQYWVPFDKNKINTYYSATPITWERWVYRYRGRVGGIPQWKGRFITDWPSNMPPFEGFYLCGDTVYPGQGIPGVTLSGINVYKRIKQKYS